MNSSTLQIGIEVDDRGSVKIRNLGQDAKTAGETGRKSFKNFRGEVSGLAADADISSTFDSLESSATRAGDRGGNSFTNFRGKVNGLKGDTDLSIGSFNTMAAITFTALVGGLAAITGGIVSIVNNAGNQAREMENLSRLAGLNSTDFQNMAFATTAAGVEADKFADISKDVHDKLGDFIATGGGGFKDFFENVGADIGLTAESLQGLSGPDVLIAVKDAMDAVNISAEEQVFYLESIASDATLLNPLLKDGGKLLKEQAAQADALGIALSDVDAQRLLEADIATKQLTGAFDGLKNKLAASLAPVITDITGKIIDGMADGEGGVDSIADAIAVGLLGALGYAVETMRFFHNGWLGIKLVGTVAINAVAKSLEILFGGMRSFLFLIDKAFDGFSALAEWMGQDIPNPFDKIEEGLATFSASATDVTKEVLANIDETNAKYDTAANQLKTYTKLIENQGEAEEKRGKTAITANNNVLVSTNATTAASISSYQQLHDAVVGPTGSMTRKYDILFGNLDSEKIATADATSDMADAYRLLMDDTVGAGGYVTEMTNQSIANFGDIKIGSRDNLTADSDSVLNQFGNVQIGVSGGSGSMTMLTDDLDGYFDEMKTTSKNITLDDNDSITKQWEGLSANQTRLIGNVVDVFGRGEDTKTSVARLAKNTLVNYAQEWAAAGIEQILQRHGQEIGASVALGTAQTGTEGSGWVDKLATGALYLGGATAAVLAGKAVGDNFAAQGGWIGDNPGGGMINQGSGTADDVFLGYTDNGMTRNWGMRDEYAFIINQKSSRKHLGMIKALDAINRDDTAQLADVFRATGGPVGDAMATTEGINDAGFDAFWTAAIKERNWASGVSAAVGYYAGTFGGMEAGKVLGPKVMGYANGGLMADRKFGWGGFISDVLDPGGYFHEQNDKDMIDAWASIDEGSSMIFGAGDSYQSQLADWWTNQWINDVGLGDIAEDWGIGSSGGQSGAQKDLSFGDIWALARKLPIVGESVAQADRTLMPYVRDMITPGKHPSMSTYEDSLSALFNGLVSEIKAQASGGLLGQLHGGTDYVRETGSYYLKQGERVEPAEYTGNDDLKAEITSLKDEISRIGFHLTEYAKETADFLRKFDEIGLGARL